MKKSQMTRAELEGLKTPPRSIIPMEYWETLYGWQVQGFTYNEIAAKLKEVSGLSVSQQTIYRTIIKVRHDKNDAYNAFLEQKTANDIQKDLSRLAVAEDRLEYLMSNALKEGREDDFRRSLDRFIKIVQVKWGLDAKADKGNEIVRKEAEVEALLNFIGRK